MGETANHYLYSGVIMKQDLSAGIIAALNALQLRPHALRGQNFLISEEIIQRIITLEPIDPQIPLLEIGAGLASLSDALIPLAGQVDLLEIEPLFAQRLRERFRENNNVTVHCTDALEFNYAERYADRPYVIYGNIPYNITSQLVKKLLIDGAQWQKMILMLQKEAAERLCHGEGRDNGPLPLLLDYVTEQKIAFTIPPEAFYPRPAVQSAIIVLTRKEDVKIDDTFLGFVNFLDAAFNLRRKTLANSLAASAYGGDRQYWLKLIQSCGFLENVRAESLNLHDMLQLYDQHISR